MCKLPIMTRRFKSPKWACSFHYALTHSDTHFNHCQFFFKCKSKYLHCNKKKIMFPYGVNLLTDSNSKLMRQPHLQLTGLCSNGKVFEVFWQLTISSRLLLELFIIKHSSSSHKHISHDSSKDITAGWSTVGASSLLTRDGRPVLSYMLQSRALHRTQQCVTLRSLWMMGVLRWCRRETASQVSQKICSTSASVKPVCSLWFIKLTTCPPEKWYPIIWRHKYCYSFMTLILFRLIV